MWDHTEAENLMFMSLSTLHNSCYNYIIRLMSGNIYASIQLYLPKISEWFCNSSSLEIFPYRKGLRHVKDQGTRVKESRSSAVQSMGRDELSTLWKAVRYFKHIEEAPGKPPEERRPYKIGEGQQGWRKQGQWGNQLHRGGKGVEQGSGERRAQLKAKTDIWKHG